MLNEIVRVGEIVERETVWTIEDQEREEGLDRDEIPDPPERTDLGELVCDLSVEADFTVDCRRPDIEIDFVEFFTPFIDTPEGVNGDAFLNLLEEVIRRPEDYADIPANFSIDNEVWKEWDDDMDIDLQMHPERIPADERQYYIDQRLMAVLSRMYVPDMDRFVTWAKERLSSSAAA